MGLSLLLEMAVSAHGDRVGFGNNSWGTTFGDLAQQASRGAAVARSRGRELVFVGRNGPAVPVLLFAASIAGVPFCPLNYRLASDQLGELIDQLDAPLVVADDDYLPMVGRSAMSTNEFLALAASNEPVAPADIDDDPAVLLFTSGTTSKPKAVVLRHENLVSYILSTVELGNAADDDAALICVPPYHVAAIGSLLSNLYAGRRVVYLPDFDAGQWLRLVGEEGISSAMVVPTMLARIVETLGDVPADVPTLRLLSYGGARMPRRVLEKALELFPCTGFCNAYGLTETSSTLALLGPDEHREAFTSTDPAVHRRLGSVGRPVPSVEVDIRSAEGSSVPAGTSGELWVRGPQVSGQYRGQVSSLDEQSWFPTRDRAMLDADGYLYIEGRLDDTIIRGGENIAPAEIEDVLATHPAVKDVAVVGLPDDEWGQRIVAAIVPNSDAMATADELRAWVRHRLRGSRTPDDVVWRTDLPHNPLGKLVRRELVEQLTVQTEH